MIVDYRLIDNSLVSLGRLLSGFCLGSSLGVFLGVLVGYSKNAARILEPTILTLIPVPPVAWIPLLVIIFGIGEMSKIILVSIGSFCTLFIHAAYGIRSADKSLIEVAYVLEKDGFSTLLNVLFPASLPVVLASMRVAMALSWTLLVSGEVIASSKGLGWLIWDSRNFARPDAMIAGMVAVGLLGKATDTLIVFLEKRLTSWRQTYRDI
nr:ABC transporter permease [cf. Phormidesmis sp. LEGE 11477]